MVLTNMGKLKKYKYTQNKVKLGPINISLNPLIDEKETNAKIEELSKKFGLPIDPTILVEDLPIGLKKIPITKPGSRYLK